MRNLLTFIGELDLSRVSGCLNCKQTIFFNGHTWRTASDNGRCPVEHDLVDGMVFIPQKPFLGFMRKDAVERYLYCLKCNGCWLVYSTGRIADESVFLFCYDKGHRPATEVKT